MNFNPATLTNKELIRMAENMPVTRELVEELVKRFDSARNIIDILRERICRPQQPNRIR